MNVSLLNASESGETYGINLLLGDTSIKYYCYRWRSWTACPFFFSLSSSDYFRSSISLVWFNLLLYVAIMLLSIFQCIPRGKIWDLSVPGHCINLGVCQTISASMNVFSDFAMLLLPIESIWRLQMAIKQKLGITAVFAVGLL